MGASETTMEMQPSLPRARQSSLTGEEIVRRVRAGETSLFEVLLRRYNQRLYRVARSILGSEIEVEDVMQEAYVRAFEHLNQFAGLARFSTWLTKIVVHEASAHRRRVVRFRALDAPRPPGKAESPPMGMMTLADPENSLFGQEVRLLLERAMDALPEEYRAVFVLREIEELDTADAAEALGVSEEVVRTRLLRARARLREDLYRRAGVTTAGLFSLHLARCDRVVHAVMPRIASGGGASGMMEAHSDE